MDRIDLHVEVTPVSYDLLSDREMEGESSGNIVARVINARKIQEERFKDYDDIICNAQMSSRLVQEFCQLDKPCTILLRKAMEKLQLSARAYDRILKVARTGADLSESENIKIEHLAEAIQFRTLDRDNWSG